MRVFAEGGAIQLRCDGCGEERTVVSGVALRTLTTHINRFKRQHAANCEVHARVAGEYEKAGRVASEIIGKFTRAKP